MMSKLYYCLYDNVAHEFFDLFYSKNDDTAKRAIKEYIIKNNSFQSSDFSLYCVLDFHQIDDTDKLELVPICSKICDCVDLLDKE